MEQLNFFEEPVIPHKYIIDASSIISQKSNEKHRRSLYKKKWEKIDELIRKGIIVTCSEIKDEIKDEELIKWIKEVGIVVIPADDEEIQKNVKIVVETVPKLIDFFQRKSSGDAFLVATAMHHNLIVITEENSDSPNKIPKTCEALGVQWVDIIGLCEREGWVF